VAFPGAAARAAEAAAEAERRSDRAQRRLHARLLQARGEVREAMPELEQVSRLQAVTRAAMCWW
jgi:hypothetical protein